MSGHSKWHNIKRKKSIEDQKRSKLFSKTSRLLTVASKQGGSDPGANPALRLAIQKAKDARMPKDNIDRAIKKGAGELVGSNFQESIYEGYGPEGGAFLINCLTDNSNRTVSEVRNIFGRYGGSLGVKGSTSYIFDSRSKEPAYTVEINQAEKASRVDDLVDLLEDHDDVQDIYHNYKFD